MGSSNVGISGFSLDTPPYRVNLADWCRWTGNSWDKVGAVVGHSFRIPGPWHNVYTMAANAVLALIDRYDVDPQRIGYLGLGTESSTDNAAGAVIIKGMVDRALDERGKPTLSRRCEVPEFKHACLGGIYALKGALRYLSVDGQGRQAIVVSADIAEYERSSTGEPTQGAGAVAMLVEENPALLAVDVQQAGSAAAYRAVDFRKPFQRFSHPGYASQTERMHDFPVFNGKYSNVCYLDEILSAVAAMLAQLGGDPRAWFDRAGAVFFHRPYHHLPRTALGLAYLSTLAANPAHHRELSTYCQGAEIALEAVLNELNRDPANIDQIAQGQLPEAAFPMCSRVLKAFRKTEVYRTAVTDKLALGSEAMNQLGNLYTAALPAWLATALEEAYHRDIDIGGQTWLAVGYGSGDAAEAIPLAVVPGWRDAAGRIGVAQVLAQATDLTETQYVALHDRRCADGLELPSSGFVIDRVGDTMSADFHDVGIEYYRYQSTFQQGQP